MPNIWGKWTFLCKAVVQRDPCALLSCHKSAAPNCEELIYKASSGENEEKRFLSSSEGTRIVFRSVVSAMSVAPRIGLYLDET